MKNAFEMPAEIVEKWRGLGFDGNSSTLLLFVPAVRAAWAEGFLQAAERRTILQIFEQVGAKDENSYKTLLEWLDERPSDEFFAAATEVLSEWLAKISSRRAAVFKGFLHVSCLKVASASATIGLKTGRQAICREEQRELARIGNQLGFTLA
jgi:hypothetical protein